jgi:hypothetical protein
MKLAVFTRKWGGRDSNPRPEDYEDFRPKRYAPTRIQRVYSLRCASNTFLLNGGPNQDQLADARLTPDVQLSGPSEAHNSRRA